MGGVTTAQSWEGVQMKYKITWKRKEQIYTEYLNLKGLIGCLEFIELHEDCELVNIEQDEDKEPLTN